MNVAIAMMGQFSVTVGDVIVDSSEWRRRQSAALVKILALSPRRSLHREQVMDLLWPEATVDDAAPRLHKAAHYARRALGSPQSLILARESVTLFPNEDVRVDANEFEVRAEKALAMRNADEAARAIDAYGGELLPNDLYEPWVQDSRDRLRLLYIQVLRLGGRWDRLTVVDPTDEHAHLQLIFGLIGRGEHRAALRQFARLERALSEELGVALSPQAAELKKRVQAAGTPEVELGAGVAPESEPASTVPATGRRGRDDLGLSADEADVLDAIAEHLTNAEIGARLQVPIRTVEGHVAALLQKFQVGDRQALVAVAANADTAVRRPVDAASAAQPGVASQVTATLPVPLTPFIGRFAERTALADALQEHRLITAAGPGGIGKTRLALSVVADQADRFADGAWFVDLVPITDPSALAPAIAFALGLGERQGRTPQETVLDWLADRETLLVLDNCEHLLDDVAVLVERMLSGSPRLTVLTTSRARLLVPFEWVFSVPGLSIEGDGDAIELFYARAAAGGSVLAPADRKSVATICRQLDGMALAIELAAARVASLGLDSVQAALGDGLQLLTGGRRTDGRHRSLRSTLDWSFELLAESDRAALRGLSVFVAPFTAESAAAVLDGSPSAAGEDVPSALGRLVDQSLLVVVPDVSGTRYRMLETVRQYGAERLVEHGESVDAALRHLRWCLNTADALVPESRDDLASWRASFDRLADELRGALAWSVSVPDHRDAAYRLAFVLADLSFARGMPGEASTRYEQAAGLTADDADAAVALDCAAGAAECRHVGTEALRLRRRSADAAIRAGDPNAAAMQLARAAELVNRGPGIIATPPEPGAVVSLLAEARSLVDDGTAAEARILCAEAFAADDRDPASLRLVEQSLGLARRAADPLAESAALDELTSIQLAHGEVHAAMASTLRRTELLAELRPTASSGLEFFDAFQMAADCAVAAGDLRAARRQAERVRDLPFNREEGHLATSRLIVATALTGDWDESLDLAARFHEGWERAGRPRAGNLTRGAHAAATVHGLRGDSAGRAQWLDVASRLETPRLPPSLLRQREFFDALVLLHRGEVDAAMQLLAADPADLPHWQNGVWRPWYGAVWAEAAVLAGHPDAAERVRQAFAVTAGNPIATAMVERAAALAGDRTGLSAAAEALANAGCRYQWARTAVMIGGADRQRGETALAMMGATAMPTW